MPRLRLQVDHVNVIWLFASFIAAVIVVFTINPDPLLPFMLALVIGALAIWVKSSVLSYLSVAFILLALSLGVRTWLELPMSHSVSSTVYGSLTITDKKVTASSTNYEGVARLSGENINFTGSVELVSTGVYEYTPGDTIEGNFTVNEFVPIGERADGVAVVLSENEPLAILNEKSFIGSMVLLREHITDTVTHGAGGEEGAVAAAMLIGDSSHVDYETWENLRRAGLTHIVVVSGMHLGIVVAFIGGLMRKFPRLLRAAVTLAVTFLFALLTGFGLSVIRAAIMLTISVIAECIDRDGDRLSALAFAGLLMLMFSPSSLFSLSLGLTFLATGGIIMLTPVFSAWIGKGLLASIFGAISTTAGAQIMCTPLLGIYTGEISLAGLLANPLAVPFVFPSMLTSAVGVLTADIIPFVADFMFELSARNARTILNFTEMLSDLPFAVIPFRERFQILWLVAATLLLVALLLFTPSAKTVRTGTVTMVFALLLPSVCFAVLSSGSATVLMRETTAAVVYGKTAVLLGVPSSYYVAEDLSETLSGMGVDDIAFMYIPSDHVHALFSTSALFGEFNVQYIGKPEADLHSLPSSEAIELDISQGAEFDFGDFTMQVDEEQVDIYFDRSIVSYHSGGVVTVLPPATRLVQSGAEIECYRVFTGW